MGRWDTLYLSGSSATLGLVPDPASSSQRVFNVPILAQSDSVLRGAKSSSICSSRSPPRHLHDLSRAASLPATFRERSTEGHSSLVVRSIESEHPAVFLGRWAPSPFPLALTHSHELGFVPHSDWPPQTVSLLKLRQMYFTRRNGIGQQSIANCTTRC
jgi:hypothetical protein